MSALWTAADAAAATGGRVDGTWEATGVSIDSRSVAAGDLFVAITGDRFDGHAFVAQALEAGAAAAMVSHVPEGCDPARLLVVDDTDDGLRALGAAARARLSDRDGGRVVGITGSVGKTGTKELMTLALGRFGKVHATEGNLNNHWGVPLTLARMPADTDFAVIEMGMNHAGELDPLSRLTRPHVTLITSVAAAHLEFFDSVEAIADAKAEIMVGLEPGGTAVLPADNRHIGRLKRHAHEREGTRVLTFGSHIGADVRMLDLAVDPDCTRVFALADDLPMAYQLAVLGRHWAFNSLGVLAVTLALGLDPVEAARGLATLQPPRGRGQRHEVTMREGPVQIIDESYNASPESMRAALNTLALARPAPGGRRIAVLGDMLELGTAGPELHEKLAADVMEQAIDLVYTAGPLMGHLHAALPKRFRGGHADDADTLIPLVTGAVASGDVIMVKGSNGSRVGRVVQALLARAEKPDPAVDRTANGH